MPMGLVNADTIKWQEMPDDVGWDFFWFSFDDRFFYLTEASFPQAVMTGERVFMTRTVCSNLKFGFSGDF